MGNMYWWLLKRLNFHVAASMNTDHVSCQVPYQIAKSQGSRPVAYGEPLGPRFVDENTKVNRWDRCMATRSSKMGWSKSLYVKMKCVVKHDHIHQLLDSEVPNIFGTQISLQAPKGNTYSVPSTTFDHPRVFGYFGMSRTRDWETLESFDPAHVYPQFCSLKQWFCRADTHVLLLEFPCLPVELTNHANLKVKRLNSIPSCCTPWWPGCHSRRL